MGLRRVRITCQQGRKQEAAAAFDLLSTLPTCCDLTHGTGQGSHWLQFLSEDLNVPRTLAQLAERTGIVGCERIVTEERNGRFDCRHRGYPLGVEHSWGSLDLPARGGWASP